MSARRFAEWRAYSELEPFGPPAEFWRAGIIASMLANVHRGKHQKPYKPEDFMPESMTEQDRPESDQESAGQMIAEQFKAFAELQRRQGSHGQ